MEWSKTWKMEFNAKKWQWTYKLEGNIISIAKEEKEFGVVIQDNLSPENI